MYKLMMAVFSQCRMEFSWSWKGMKVRTSWNQWRHEIMEMKIPPKTMSQKMMMPRSLSTSRPLLSGFSSLKSRVCSACSIMETQSNLRCPRAVKTVLSVSRLYSRKFILLTKSRLTTEVPSSSTLAQSLLFGLVKKSRIQIACKYPNWPSSNCRSCTTQT